VDAFLEVNTRESDAKAHSGRDERRSDDSGSRIITIRPRRSP
jgi:hypothetical protein